MEIRKLTGWLYNVYSVLFNNTGTAIPLMMSITMVVLCICRHTHRMGDVSKNLGYLIKLRLALHVLDLLKWLGFTLHR